MTEIRKSLGLEFSRVLHNVRLDSQKSLNRFPSTTGFIQQLNVPRNGLVVSGWHQLLSSQDLSTLGPQRTRTLAASFPFGLTPLFTHPLYVALLKNSREYVTRVPQPASIVLTEWTALNVYPVANHSLLETNWCLFRRR